MANTGEGQDSLRKPDDDAVRSRLGLGSDDAPPVAGELLFDDYDDGGGVDDLLGIVRDSADDNETEDVALVADDESDIEFEDDVIVFEDETPAVQSNSNPAAVESMAGENVVEFSDLEDDDLVFGDDDEEEDVAAAVAPGAGPREEEPIRKNEQPSDDSYWNELDRWVWDDEPPTSVSSENEKDEADSENA